MKWNYIGLGARVVSSLAIGIVLARMLGPKPFGLVAIATLVIGLGTLIADFGFGAALIQMPEITTEEIRFVFTAQVLLGAAFTTAGLATAGLFARAFHQPEAAPILRALMFTFFLQSLGQTAACLLRRNLKFKQIQVAQVGSYLIAYVAVGIPMAYYGFGVWALVVAQILQVLINAAAQFAASPHSIYPTFSFKHRKLFHFGSKVIGTNLANWTIYNLDTAIAGRCFGAYDLGLYNRAFTSATMPVNNATIGFQQVLFSGTARTDQDRGDKLKRAYVGAITLIAIIMMPLYAGLAMASGTVVAALYGSQWAQSAPLLTAFAVAMPFHAIMSVAGPFLWGVNRVESEFRMQILVGTISIPTFLLAYRISLLALACAVAAIYVLRFIVMTYAAMKTFQIAASVIVRALLRPTAVGVVVGFAIYLVDLNLAILGSALARLMLDLLVGTVMFGLALTVGRNKIYGVDGGWLLKKVQNGIPKILYPLLPE